MLLRLRAPHPPATRLRGPMLHMHQVNVLNLATIRSCPFGSPRVLETPGAHAGTGTSVSPAPLAVEGNTGAPFVGSCTQGTTIKTLDSKIQTTISEASSDPFCPLPLKIVTPVNLPAFERYLQDYPFPGTKRYLISGFRYGFNIGFRGSFKDVNARPCNLLSAISNADKVSEAIRKEVTRGHTLDPSPSPLPSPTHCSPIAIGPYI